MVSKDKEGKATSLLKKASTHIGLIAAIITGLVTVGGAAVGVGNWVIENVNAKADARIANLQKEMEENDKRQELATTRLELLSLMSHNPENVLEIEMLAKHYFIDLEGDFYMTEKYSEYAKKYGADTSFVVMH